MVAAVVVPDPTWIGGLYDGGDGDEAATLVWDHGSAVVPAGIALLAILAALVVAAPAHAIVARFPLGAPCPARRLPPDARSPRDRRRRGRARWRGDGAVLA